MLSHSPDQCPTVRDKLPHCLLPRLVFRVGSYVVLQPNSKRARLIQNIQRTVVELTQLADEVGLVKLPSLTHGNLSRDLPEREIRFKQTNVAALADIETVVLLPGLISQVVLNVVGEFVRPVARVRRVSHRVPSVDPLLKIVDNFTVARRHVRPDYLCLAPGDFRRLRQ